MSYEIINIKNCKIKRKIQNIKSLDILTELYQGKLYLYLLKKFIDDCVNYLGTNIFSIKKTFSRTITNILSSWFFCLYSEYDFSNNYFFPTNYKNIQPLKNILIDLCKYDNKIIDPNKNINIILNNLVNNYKHQLFLLNNYHNTSFYKIYKNNYTITKTINKDYYKFNIDIPFPIKENKLKYLLTNIQISIKKYNYLLSKYCGPKDKIDHYIWTIIYRYQLLGSNNHQLALLPNIFHKFNTDYNLNFECFSSALNNTFYNYCSLYYDLEIYFGSIGSFFNIVPLKGTFSCNPPFQKEIINNSINKIFTCLNNTTEDLTFIITIPVWDIIGKKIINNNNTIDYGDFQIINDIRNSQFLKEIKIIPKEKFTYLDHNFELYKNKTIQNTYVIILSNKKDYNNYLDNYVFE